jgi:hypothetical protein
MQTAPQPVSPGACSNPSPPQPPNPSSPRTAIDAAVAKVRQLGFTVADTSTYDPSRTLNVVVAVRSGSADGTAQQAFGTDTSDTSAGISLVWQDDTTSALSYQLYSSADPQCCPTGGSVTVRYHWDGTKLNVASSVPKPRYERAREPHIFHPAEVEEVRTKLERLPDRTLVAVLAYSGPRPEEVVCRLTWGDIGERTIR